MWLTAAPTALAQTDTLTGRPLFREPPTLLADPGGTTVHPLHAHPALIDGQLFITYNGRVPGPIIPALPGSRLQIQLTNSLIPFTAEELANFNPPVLRSNESDEVKKLLVKSSDITNLHTHGLHVSPQGRSDNVLLKINRGRSNLFTINLPWFHAPGTHWYHAHLHGSTALQVQGGMAGALLVQPRTREEGLNPPEFAILDLTTVLRLGNSWSPDAESLSKKADPATREVLDRRSAAAEADYLATAAHRLRDQLSKRTLDELTAGVEGQGDQKLVRALREKQIVPPPIFEVNGLFNPALALLPGQIYRFRIVNAGSRRVDYKRLWIDGGSLYLAAYDGINLTHLPRNPTQKGCSNTLGFVCYDVDNPLELAPGNRADVYFIPERVGIHTLMMEGQIRVSGLDEPMVTRRFTQELMTIRVSNPDLSADSKMTGEESTAYVNRFLQVLDERLRTLQNTVPYQSYLRSFTAAPQIKRTMKFDIGPLGVAPPPPPPGTRTRTFLINERDYNEIINGEMQGLSDYLGKDQRDCPQGMAAPCPPRARTEEEWTIVNRSGRPHPFHIHVNPFWVQDIVERENPDPNLSCSERGPLVSARERARQTGIPDPRLDRWQDTISLPECGGSATVRHRFSDFVGLFVVHCHILQHEDRGMMINILIVPHDETDPQGYFEEQQADNDRINREINGPGWTAGHGHGHEEH